MQLAWASIPVLPNKTGVGGGVVRFDTGWWFVHGPLLLLPNGVRLVGQGMDRTGIFFGPETMGSAPTALTAALRTRGD